MPLARALISNRKRSESRSDSDPGRSALLMRMRSADLDDPGLEGLDDVARSGLQDEDDEVGAGQDVELGLADADGLDEDAVHAEGVEDVGRVGGRRRQAAVAVAGGQRADEDARSSPMRSCIRTRSPRKAPPVKGLEGSTAMIPTRRGRP